MIEWSNIDDVERAGRSVTKKPQAGMSGGSQQIHATRWIWFFNARDERKGPYVNRRYCGHVDVCRHQRHVAT